MTTRAAKVTRRFVLVVGLLAGMGYALMALRTEPVYASTCNCTQMYVIAERTCSFYNGQVTDFVCPYNPPADSQFEFQCTTTGPFIFNCS